MTIALVAVTNLLLAARNMSQEQLNDIDTTYEISTDSNFFGQAENKNLVALPDDYANELLVKGYQFVSDTDRLELYVKERNFNIAVYDKVSGYIWYSVYPDYNKYMLSGTSKYFVESGVVIEYFNLDNILVDDSKSYLSGPKFNVNCTFDYESVTDGLKAHLEFEDLAISFDITVRVEAGKLIVHLPIDSLEEGDIEKKVLGLDGEVTTKTISYRLKSVYLFPYFGSNNYEINGYSMIPDGSGALIRYTEDRSSTAYTKRLYGPDEGISKYSEKDNAYYLYDELTASLPAFGVNHGYHQAAFLSVITEGDAFTEIHSYPYGYNSYQFNTTFAKFIVRERYSIQTSSNETDSFQLINQEAYQSDYTIEYHFLANEAATYSGMAAKYRTLLDLESKAITPAVNLALIGMDYKNGLFGKNYVEMTKYNDVQDIVSELVSAGIDDMNLLYLAWNKGGYYDQSSSKVKVAPNLGGTKDFKEMLAYLDSLGIDIAFYSNPMIAYDQSLGSKVIKKITLSVFATNDVQSSLFRTTFFTNPLYIAEKILDRSDFYDKYDMDNFVFDSVGDNLFTYRYNSVDYLRNDTITLMQSELADLEDYSIGLYVPNAYLWKYIDAYYDAPIESNKYAYITDSIPFVQLVLNGHATMYSSYVNYVSDYNVFALRLIEYGISPSFLLTKESTHLLRYTNSEYIYTSQFDLWKDTITEITKEVIEPLKTVAGEQMISHRYIESGLAEVVYANGVKIYINYTNQPITINALEIPNNSYKVVTS